MGCHWGAPAAAGTGELRALVPADKTGEPVRGPRAVEAGKAEIPGEREGRGGEEMVRIGDSKKQTCLTNQFVLLQYFQLT